MLKKIKLKNFKCLEEAEINLSRINIFIGPNASGKSSVIHGLMVLKQSVNTEYLKLNGNYIRLGEYEDVVFKHEPNRNIGFELELREKIPELKDLGMEDVDIYYSVAFKSDLRLYYHEAQAEIGKYKIFTTYNRETGGERVDPGEISPTEGIVLKIESRSSVGLPFYLSAAQYPKGKYPKIERLYDAITNTLKGLQFIPTIRGFLEPEYPLGDKEESEFLIYPQIYTTMGEITTTLCYNESLKAKVSNIMSSVLETELDVPIKPGKRTTITSDKASKIVNEGFGFNQLSWLFSQLITAPRGSLVAVEEPEIHLHPAAQSKLVDTLIEIAEDEDKQLLITTHSEHILLRALTNVANGRIGQNDISVYYFEHGKKPEELKVDEKGRLNKGLKGFFEHDVEELSEYLKTLIGREH